MRESEYRMQRAADTKRIALILRQLEFVQLRMEALEAILAEVVKPILERDPEWLKKKMDAKHLEILNAQAIKDKEAREKAEEERRKPKLILPAGVNGNGHG